MSYRGIELPNQLAQYAKMQQIQGAQQQNRLAEAQMQEYERKLANSNRLRTLDPASPGYLNEVMRIDPNLASEISLRRQQQTTAERQAASAESETKSRGLSTWQSLARDAALTPSDDVLQMLARQSVALGVADEATAQSRLQQFLAMPPEQRSQVLSQAGAPAAVPSKPTPAETEEIVMRLQDPNLPPSLRQALQSRLTMLTTREPKEPRESKEDPRTVVAFRETDAAGNVTLVNKFGEVITPTAPVKGKPSATFEKTTAQRKQLGLDLNRAIVELTAATAKNGLINQSTGSGAGRLVDIGAGFFGQATPGAIAGGKIAPIADLVLKMVPRFEGPQSDKDTASYERAAGQLADTTLPNEIRRQAGITVLRLMKDRKNQFVSADMAAEGAGAGNVAAPAAPDTQSSTGRREIAPGVFVTERP
jgi:hypothetical protein